MPQLTFSDGTLLPLSISAALGLQPETRACWRTIADQQGGKAGRKPGSVPHRPPSPGLWGGGGGSSLSNRRCRRPLAARNGRSGTVGQPLLRGPKPWPCSRPGFTEPAPLDAAGALLPHLCTLACAAGMALRHRRCVSVALSSRFPALGVTQQAWPLGSPDFPQPDPPGPQEPLPQERVSLEHSREAASRDHLTCFPASQLKRAWADGDGVLGSRHPGAVAQPDRATVS